jgi:hypothetical protein
VAVLISLFALAGCGGGGQFCRRTLADAGCDLYVTTDHCPSCPDGFVPIDSNSSFGCVPSDIGCQ